MTLEEEEEGMGTGTGSKATGLRMEGVVEEEGTMSEKGLGAGQSPMLVAMSCTNGCQYQ